MIRFTREELVEFVRALDRNLSAGASVLVVGGAAASLAYDSGTRTADIDVSMLKGSDVDFSRAGARAQEETGLDVSLGSAALAHLPDNYEDRVKDLRGPLNLKNLSIIVPDKYDLVISKAARGYEHDVAAIEGIHERHPLSERTLIKRFESEFMNTAATGTRSLQINMAQVIDSLYGAKASREAAERWGVLPPSTRLGRRRR